MQIKSKDFEHEGMIPVKFTCKGEDISPHLKWSEPPKNTKSYALACTDPDAPGGNWIHWYICDIPADVTEISQGGPVPGKEVTNDFGKTSYGGPCPPSGTHRYFFRIYALDIKQLEGIKKNNFMEKVKDHSIDSAELMGKFSK
ncbi:MAG: hypothetical protein BAJALOKI1v1_1710006 [Promethearchaeota archaeon]|nr:MAG: hypothetical protein BAJALOKI1v1_1710006 [Candidatus Lokiarchaeota archaeon]